MSQAALDILADLRPMLADLDEAIARWMRPGVIRGSQYVVRSSPGLYLRALGDDRYQPTGILHASIWEAVTAATLAFHVRGSEGERGTRVHYLEALKAERAEMARLIAVVESRLNPYGPDALPNSVCEELEASQVDA